jgi:hypothetical protein
MIAIRRVAAAFLASEQRRGGPVGGAVVVERFPGSGRLLKVENLVTGGVRVHPAEQVAFIVGHRRGDLGDDVLGAEPADLVDHQVVHRPVRAVPVHRELPEIASTDHDRDVLMVVAGDRHRVHGLGEYRVGHGPAPPVGVEHRRQLDLKRAHVAAGRVERALRDPPVDGRHPPRLGVVGNQALPAGHRAVAHGPLVGDARLPPAAHPHPDRGEFGRFPVLGRQFAALVEVDAQRRRPQSEDHRRVGRADTGRRAASHSSSGASAGRISRAAPMRRPVAAVTVGPLSA